MRGKGVSVTMRGKGVSFNRMAYLQINPEDIGVGGLLRALSATAHRRTSRALLAGLIFLRVPRRHLTRLHLTRRHRHAVVERR